MADKMDIHAFKINTGESSVSIVEVIEQISRDQLRDRIRSVGFSKMRLEHSDYDAENDLWYLDFGKFRDSHGPGKASSQTPVEGFDFEDDEQFLEEAACLYDPNSSHMVIQYNHHGSRAGSIQDYLSAYDPQYTNIYELLPKMDDSIQQKFQRRTGLRELFLKLSPRQMTAEDRQAGRSLEDAINLGAAANGETVALTISAARAKEGRLNQRVEEMFNAAKRVLNRNPEAVNQLKLKVVTADDKIELLDFVKHRLKYTVPNMPKGRDLRFPREDRYRALKRAYDQWKNLF